MMAEYIDREALLGAISKIGESPLSEWDTVGVVSLVANQPAADVAPVRRAHWIPIYASELTGWNPEFAGRDPIEGYRCSRCGADAILSCNDDFVLSNYCPNCGAKMEVPNDD